MSSLFNVYKKISKKYGAKSNFEYIPIISNQNKYISQIKSTKNIYQRNKDKDINYLKAEPTITKISDRTFRITANTFIKDLYLYAENTNFSDNYITLLKGEEIIITTDKDVSLNDIKLSSINNI